MAYLMNRKQVKSKDEADGRGLESGLLGTLQKSASGNSNKSANSNDWKKELRDSYRNSAKWAVKDSNKAFDKTISETGRNALSRGLGRSSYTTQTLANLETDKNEAGNRIKTEFEAEYQKALRQRESEEEQRKLEREKLEEDRRQFDAQMAANAAASAGGGGGGGRGGRGGNTGGDTGGNTGGGNGDDLGLGRNSIWNGYPGPIVTNITPSTSTGTISDAVKNRLNRHIR